MTVQDVLNLLEKNKDPRGIENWRKFGSNKMNSYRIGLTKLKTLCKIIGKDHKLAVKLWKVNEYDVKITSMLIDDPAFVTEAQINKQVKEMGKGMFAHVFCTVLMAKLPFLKKKVDEWTTSKDDLIRRCGYLCLYVLAKRDDKLDDKYFESFLKIIEKDLQQEENMVKDAMNGAILTIGMRNKNLNKKAIDVARKIGKVEVYYGDNSCRAVDCIKHLTGDRIQKSLK